MRVKRYLRLLALLGLAICYVSSTAMAQDVSDPFWDLQPLPEQDLREARGGFVVAGYDIEIGLLVETQGQLVHAFVSDPEALKDALTAAGQDASIYPADVTSLPNNGVTIFRNEDDNVTISQMVRLDAVIVNEIESAQAMTAFSSFEASLPLPEIFSGF